MRSPHFEIGFSKVLYTTICVKSGRCIVNDRSGDIFQHFRTVQVAIGSIFGEVIYAEAAGMG